MSVLETLGKLEDPQYIDVDRLAYIDVQRERGRVVLVPPRDVLQLDIDYSPFCQYVASEKCWRLTGIQVVRAHTQPSKTQGHHHVYLLLDRKIPTKHRALLQAALGSDLNREAASEYRYRNGIIFPFVMIEDKPKEIPEWAKKKYVWGLGWIEQILGL